MVKFRQDPDTNTYSWLYTGGCYKNGSPVNYEDADIGSSHSFKDVQFEVRMDHRDWSQIQILPEEAELLQQMAEQEKEANSTEPAKPKETAQEKKIRKKKEEIEKEAKAGKNEYRPKGNYMFHEFFLFISFITLFGAIVLIGILVWQIISMKNAPGEEGQQLIQSNNE